MLLTVIGWPTTSVKAQGSGVVASIAIDTANTIVPLVLRLEQNTRPDIRSVRITAKMPTKIVSFQVDTSKVVCTPIGESAIQVSPLQDTAYFQMGNNVPVGRFLTDSIIRNQTFIVEFLNANEQSVFSQEILIFIDKNVALPGPCNRTTLSFRTGVDQSGALLSAGSDDLNWRLVSAPSGSGITPQQAIASTINLPTTTSQWISPTMNGGPYVGGEYVYERSFCVSAAGTYTFKGQIMVDNTCKVYVDNVNSTPILTHNSWSNWSTMTSMTVSLAAGAHKIIVVVTNWAASWGGPTVSGFNLDAALTSNSSTLGLSSDDCCNPKSWIRVRKLWDKNCNGKKDVGDAGIDGWPLTLTSSSGTINATTAGGGVYTFGPLNPGTYIISENILSGYTPSSSAGPYSINLGQNQTVYREFLNCKVPECKDLFTQGESHEECCQFNFSLSNALGPISRIQYFVTGGAVTSIQTSPCVPNGIIPTNPLGSTWGALFYSPACNNAVDVKFGAYSTNATGIICVQFVFQYKIGTSSFTCDTTICFQCERAPKECGNALKVVPQPYLPQVNTDWRTFTLTNVKQPASQISHINISFTTEPALHHIGGNLFAKSGLLNTNRNWTVANSGGAVNPYTQIRLNCNGTTNPHGPAATDWVKFNLGVDKTLNYSGIVHLKIGYCDGDTCELDYAWNPPVNNGVGTVIAKKPPLNTHIISMEITPIDSSTSFSVELVDTTATIIAITAPSPSPDFDSGNLHGSDVSSFGNNALYTLRYSTWPNIKNDIAIVYTLNSVSSNDSIPVLIRYFDDSGRQIGVNNQTVLVSDILSKVNPPMTNRGSNDMFITSVVPNPGSETMTFTYTLGSGEDARLELFNSLGQSVALVSEGYQTKGEHQSTLNVSSLAEGTYYLHLTTRFGKASAVVKVIH
jgi:hypothetical protein